ncbi:hypothetical protein SDC9_138441 [bioreactor metagenome]|uniref:Uncharacterized protein n=1 Tax=bioreactor metagenome TaxID=1076179 RepID=A0A645DRH7_9ZZZZ
MAIVLERHRGVAGKPDGFEIQRERFEDILLKRAMPVVVHAVGVQVGLLVQYFHEGMVLYSTRYGKWFSIGVDQRCQNHLDAHTGKVFDELLHGSAAWVIENQS